MYISLEIQKQVAPANNIYYYKENAHFDPGSYIINYNNLSGVEYTRKSMESDPEQAYSILS